MAIDRFCTVIWWFVWVRGAPWSAHARQWQLRAANAGSPGSSRGAASALLRTTFTRRGREGAEGEGWLHRGLRCARWEDGALLSAKLAEVGESWAWSGCPY